MGRFQRVIHATNFRQFIFGGPEFLFRVAYGGRPLFVVTDLALDIRKLLAGRFYPVRDFRDIRLVLREIGDCRGEFIK